MRMSDWSSDVCSSDLGQPPQLCSPDFYRACRARLNANGILVVNLCDHAGKNEPILRRLRECFGRIITISVEVGMNLVVFAFRDERDRFDREKRSEEHKSELQSLMRISSAVFCLNKKTDKN